MTAVSIRPADAGQTGLLSETGQRLFVQTYGNISGAEDLAAHVEDYFGERAVSAELAKTGVRYFLAWDNGDVAGFLKTRESDIPDAIPAAAATEVQQLYVDANHQRKGIGRLLMDAAVAVARDAGHEGVWLSVWQEAPWAIHFYQDYGFHTVGTTDFWLGKSKYTDFLMWLPVSTG